jgi:hypothetical protein
MKLVPSTEEDIKRISSWIENDPYHHECLNPFWWITGVEGSLLCFCLQDSEGPVCYVRLDEKNLDNLIRLHTQFASREEVSRSRLVDGMLKYIPVIISFARDRGALGIVFMSLSETLIAFMEKNYGFKEAEDDDYVLRFEVGSTV